jgi:hypothetical protein
MSKNGKSYSKFHLTEGLIFNIYYMEYIIKEDNLFISLKEGDIKYNHKYNNNLDLLLRIGDYQQHIWNNIGLLYSSWVWDELNKLFNHIDKCLDSNLYFIIDDTKTKVKIGRSRNVDKRFKQLKSTTPFDIELLKVIDNGGMYESYLHKEFIDNNLSFSNPFDGFTEWFYIDDKLNRFIYNIDLKKLQKKYGK